MNDKQIEEAAYDIVQVLFKDEVRPTLMLEIQWAREILVAKIIKSHVKEAA